MTIKSEVWSIHLVAKTYGQRPSSLLGDYDPWTSLQLDKAVCLVGLGIEGAIQEMDKVGPEDDPTWVPRYTLREILDPEFRLPLSSDSGDIPEAIQQVDGIKYDEVT